MPCLPCCVTRLLRHLGLLIAPKRSYTKTANSHHRFHCHPNLVKDVPKSAAPNQLWVSDYTYLPTRQGTMYLSLVTDAYSRRIVGHHVHPSRHTADCGAALDRAVRGAGTHGHHLPFRPEQPVRLRRLPGRPEKSEAVLLDNRRPRLRPEGAGQARQRHFERRISICAPRLPYLGPPARRPNRAPQPARPIQVQLRLTNMLGRIILSLPAKNYGAGQQALSLQAAGQSLHAGVYVVRITLDGKTFSSKLTV